MNKTVLKELIERQVTASVTNAFARNIDSIGEQLAKEFLKDKEFKNELKEMVRQAFKKTMLAFEQEVPVDAKEDKHP